MHSAYSQNLSSVRLLPWDCISSLTSCSLTPLKSPFIGQFNIVLEFPIHLSPSCCMLLSVASSTLHLSSLESLYSRLLWYYLLLSYCCCHSRIAWWIVYLRHLFSLGVAWMYGGDSRTYNRVLLPDPLVVLMKCWFLCILDVHLQASIQTWWMRSTRKCVLTLHSIWALVFCTKHSEWLNEC